MSLYDLHVSGGCIPDNCPLCWQECGCCLLPLSDCQCQTPERPVTYGMCYGCGSVEVRLNNATGHRCPPGVGENERYPTGYGCEVCS